MVSALGLGSQWGGKPAAGCAPRTGRGRSAWKDPDSPTVLRVMASCLTLMEGGQEGGGLALEEQNFIAAQGLCGEQTGGGRSG